jgi:hypothetical protein
MKYITTPHTLPLIRKLALFVALAGLFFSGVVAQAHPYASGVTGTNGTGDVSFIMNEAGATVDVVFENGQTNHMGVLPRGATNFNIGTHTSFRIICFKTGNGNPTLISSDNFSNSVWNVPTTSGTFGMGGVGANKNPSIGTNFGRLYVAQRNAFTTSTNTKPVGLYLLNADQTYVKGPIGNGFYSGSGGVGPYRVRVNEDGTVLVSDFSTANASLFQYSPDLSSSNLVLGIIGQNPAVAAGIHGDLFGCGIMRGSLAGGDLVLYTFDSGMPTPSDTNCIKGPLTGPGSFNCVFRYNIGSGPLPWNKRPDYAYTYGLDGIAELRTEGDIGKDGKIFCAFGRANASNPNLQILRPPPTTNGITGDIANATVQEAAKSATNWVYTGGVNPPFNLPPNGAASDPWVGQNGSGVNNGTYAGVRISPDGAYVAAVDINNGVTIANLTNGVPNDGTIFGIVQGNVGATTGLNQAQARGMDWDAANNIWIASSGQGLLRCFSLGLTTTCVSSNDWTGTNGTFQFVVPALQSSIAIINPNASQNYVNNSVNAGTPIPGVFRITLNTNDTTGMGPTTVGFVRGGTGGIIGGANVTNGGTNYATPPTVTFNNANTGGSNAAAVAVISGGKVTGLIVTSPGSGYTSTPGISFSGGGGSNATATAIRGLGFAQYTLNTNEKPNGVTITNNAVIFPAGVFSGSNGPNWNVDVKVIPTVYPVSGPTYSFTVRLIGGTNYAATAPTSGGIAILNTGPQFVQVAPAAPTTLGGMNRGIPNDQARFIVTRYGDTNGPNNDAVNPIVARPLTIPAVSYFPPTTGSNFMAKPGEDFTALAQRFTGAAPIDGAPGITINPGEVTITAAVGNPVKHVDTNLRTTNLTVIVNLTNVCDTGGSPGCNTNLLSGEGYPYQAAANSLVLSEFDNAVGGEVVLWSNPLTNSFDSTNWTLVYASINQGASPTLPTVVSNYDNSATGPGNYTVWFGKPVNDQINDGGVTVPQSAAMLANGWTNALKLSVNKNPAFAGESGVNLYPQIPGAPWNGGSNFMGFQGNYALRFDMYLSLYDFGINNPAIGTPAREFAAFGINHFGTNANWRLDSNPRADGTGARPINADGEWCTIGAASGSITPADYDMFISPAWAQFAANGTPIVQTIPFTTNSSTIAPFTNAYQSFPGIYTGVTNLFANAGVPNDQNSQNNNAFGGAPQNGIIKYPPFVGINQNGGAPDNFWVDVSLELSRQTNLSLLLARQLIFSSAITPTPVAGVANPIAPFNGTPMLGYLDPNIDISDYSAFVYFSNMRVVELSPFIPWTNQPASVIVTQGTTLTLTSAATFASNPLTNVWYFSTTNGPNVLGRRDNGTPTAAIVTNIFTATNGSSSLLLPSIQDPTNYIATWSDQAGSVTSFVASIEILKGPGDKTDILGGNVNFTVVPLGNAPPTSYTWMFNGTNLFSPGKYVGTNTATLTINNVAVADAGFYSVLAANAFSSIVVGGNLFVNVDGVPPYQFSGVTVSTNNLSVALAFTTADTNDLTSSFTLQSAGVVTGPYTNNFTGAFAGTNPNFIVTVPKTNAVMFYRLKHN